MSGSEADLMEDSRDCEDQDEDDALTQRNVTDYGQNKENSATSEGDSPYSAAKDTLTNIKNFQDSAGVADLDIHSLAPRSANTPDLGATLAAG